MAERRQTVVCTINGRVFRLDRDEVVRKMRRVEPEAVRDHGVSIGGREYPVKQVIAAVTGLDRLDFQTMQARSVLQRLGFEPWRGGPASRASGQ